MDTNTIEALTTLKVVFFPEDGKWIAHGVNYGIVAHGRTVEEATYEFAWAVVGRIVANVRHNRQPFNGVGPAPETISALFDEADTQLPERQIPLPSGSNLPPAFLAAKIIQSGKLLSKLN